MDLLYVSDASQMSLRCLSDASHGFAIRLTWMCSPFATQNETHEAAAGLGYNHRMNNGFAQQLDRWGPQRDYGAVSVAAARAYCGELTRTHYENFSVAT